METYTDPAKVSELDFYLSYFWRERVRRYSAEIFARSKEPTNWMGEKMERSRKERVLKCA